MDAYLERMEAKMDANKDKMKAWLDEMRALRKEKTAYEEETEACLEMAKANPEQMKAGLVEMEAAVDVFEERLDKMYTTDLECNPENYDAVEEHQEVHKKGAAVETIGALEDRYGDRHLAEETDPGRWRVPEEVGRRPQTDDPPCRSRTE
jgi:hypothetical protein